MNAVIARTAELNQQVGGLFDAEAYMDVNPDVRDAVNGDATLATMHYIRHGNSENRVVDQQGTKLAIGKPEAAPGISFFGYGALSPSTGDLKSDQMILSNNEQYALIFHRDGRLILYNIANGLVPVWEANRKGNTDDGFVAMQGDGNFVIYDDDRDAEFHTKTYPSKGRASREFRLEVMDQGYLRIIDTLNNQELWNSRNGRLARAVPNP